VGVDKFRIPEDFFDALVSMELLSLQNGFYTNAEDVNVYCVKGKEDYMGDYFM
jgi:hypothetical protein